MSYNKRYRCTECGISIEYNVFDYSTKHYDVPLCRDCQDWIKDMSFESTWETIGLYFALKERGVPAELEKNDGYKTIDIAVTDAKVNIEVDGRHHNYNPQQALADLKRTYHSFKKGYLTLRIPNALIKDNLDEAADFITAFLSESRDRKFSP